MFSFRWRGSSITRIPGEGWHLWTPGWGRSVKVGSFWQALKEAKRRSKGGSPGGNGQRRG